MTICYLNTDLDLVAVDDLTPLAAAFEALGVHPLHVSRVKEGEWMGAKAGQWCATLETDETFKEAEPNVAALIAAVEKLSEPMRRVWAACTLREFNIGYDCGSEPWAFNNGLSEEVVRRLAAAGASLRITLYPPEPPH